MLIEELSEAEASLRRIKKISKCIKLIVGMVLALFCIVWTVSMLMAGLSFFSVIPKDFFTVDISTAVPFGFYGLATILLMIILYGIFNNIAKGSTPFTKSQVRRFRWAALVLLVGAIAEAVFSNGMQLLIQSDSLNVEYRDSSGSSILPINAGSILGAALLFSLSFVFEYGVLLQEFSDDTL